MHKKSHILKSPYKDINKAIWLISLTSLISKSGNAVLVFFSIYMTSLLKFSVIDTSKILAFYGLGSILGSYFGGLSIEKYGCLKVQKYSFLLAAILFLWLEQTDHFLLLSILMSLIGFFLAAARPANSESIAKSTPQKSLPTAYALNYQAINLGNAIGPMLGGALATIDYKWIFRMDALLNLSAALALAVFFKNKSDIESEGNKNNHQISFSSPWYNKKFVVFLILSLLLGISFFQLFSNYPIYLSEHYKLSNTQFGTIMAVNGIIILTMQSIITRAIQEYNTLKIIGLGGFFICSGFFILPLHAGFYYAIFSMILITIGEILALPFMQNYVANIAPGSARGRYLGIFTATFSMPLLLSPTIGGYIYNSAGASSLWFMIGILGIFIIAGFFMMAGSFKQAQANV